MKKLAEKVLSFIVSEVSMEDLYIAVEKELQPLEALFHDVDHAHGKEAFKVLQQSMNMDPEMVMKHIQAAHKAYKKLAPQVEEE